MPNSGDALDGRDCRDGFTGVAVRDAARGSLRDCSGSWATGLRDALEQLVDNCLSSNVVQHLEQGVIAKGRLLVIWQRNHL